MSYNESYADKNLSDYAYGNGVDKGAATKYGDVFVEHTSQDLEAACDGVTCYVACSCKNNGPDDEDGWFSTIAEAQHGNPNAQVYTVTSDIHYSRDSVSTSSLNDLTIATASTTALANQTPISRASTLSSLTIDAPTLKTASTSGTKATCYKKVPCADGYFATEPTSDQRAAIEFDEDTSTGVTCYKPTGCKTSDNYQDYYVSDYYEEYEGKICYYYPIPNSLDIMFYDLNGGAGMDCGLYTVNYEVYNSSEGNTVSQWWDLSESLTFDAYYYSGSRYYSMIDEPVTPADIRLTVDYNENYSPIYTITQYNVSVNRIYLDGKYYKSGDTINLTVTDDVNGYTFTNQPLTLHISYDQGCMNTCPSGYYDTLTSCQSALVAGYQCELQSNNCYKVVEIPCPDGYYNTEPTTAQRNAMDFDEDTSTGITCYKPTCKTGDWFVPSYCNQYPGACGSSVSYENTTCYESLIPDDIYFSTTLGDPATCGFTSTYSITSKNGENLSAIELDNEDVMVGIKCGTNIQTYNTTLYRTDATNKSTFNYECNRGEATFTSISIGGYTYTGPGDTITLDLGRAGTHDFRVNISSDMQGDQCMTPCPDGYYSTEADCKNEYSYMYGYAHTCVYDSSSNCYGKGTCPSGYFLGKPSDSDFEYVVQSTSPSGADCYKAVTCVKGKDTNGSCPSGSNQIAYYPPLTCCEELPYYLNLFINGTLNGGSYEYTTTYTVTTESGQGNSSWTVSDLTNANVDLSCNDSYPPTQFKGLTFHHNASASANTKTITGFYCSGLPELEAVGIPSVSLYDGSEITMTVAGQGGRNLHVKINYSTYDPCGQTPGYYARESDCEASITNANTQTCSQVQAGSYYCYKITEKTCPDGYYSSIPNTSYFTTSSSGGCYKATGCKTANGYYTSRPNTTYFTTSSTSSNGVTCYYATGCASGYTTSGSGTSYKSGNVTCYKESSSNSCPTDIWFMVIKHSDDDTPHYQLAYNMTKNGTICLTNQSSPNSYCNLSNNMWYTASVNVYVGYNYTINNANWDLTDDPNGSYDGAGYDVGEITKVNYITINGNKYYDGNTINLDVVDVADDCEMTLHLGLYNSSDFQN